MGNRFGKNIMNKAGVNPLDDDDDDDVKAATITTRSTISATSVRIKVRMTAKQLKDLAAQVDMSKGTSNSELGSLILQHFLEGKLISDSSPVVAAGHGCRLLKTPRGRTILSTIHEDKIDVELFDSVYNHYFTFFFIVDTKRKWQNGQASVAR